MNLPIVISTNPYTGLVDGNDSGYREVPDVDSEEEMVDAGCMMLTTGDYDGRDIHGGRKRVLPGGVVCGKLLLRRFFAEGIELLDGVIQRITGKEMQLQLVDGYRTPVRQAAGFTEIMAELADRDGFRLGQLAPWQLVKYGRLADLTFAWVPVDRDSEYPVAWAMLMNDRKFTGSLSQAIDGGVITGTLDQAVHHYIVHSVNSKTGMAANRKIPILGSKNAHTGGGAVDVMVRGKLNGSNRPLSHVPFDYPSPISGMTYLERNENFDDYLTHARTDHILAEHLRKLGFASPGDFKRSDWELFQKANRLRFHAFMAAGGSFYDPGDPLQIGECWHFQLGNKIYNHTGAVLLAETTLSDKHPDAGNTCHSLLRMKPESRIAVRTGTSAWRLVEAKYGHVA